MDTDPIRIEVGMEVFTSDGQKLGKVSHVWPVVDDVSSGMSSRGRFQVDEGGILGLGAKHLYVPYSDIDDHVHVDEQRQHGDGGAPERIGGDRHVVFAPIGFLADHVEILYDLDIEARAMAIERGLSYARRLQTTVTWWPRSAKVAARSLAYCDVDATSG